MIKPKDLPQSKSQLVFCSLVRFLRHLLCKYRTMMRRSTRNKELQSGHWSFCRGNSRKVLLRICCLGSYLRVIFALIPRCRKPVWCSLLCIDLIPILNPKVMRSLWLMFLEHLHLSLSWRYFVAVHPADCRNRLRQNQFSWYSRLVSSVAHWRGSP